jgi:hypothetical protein
MNKNWSCPECGPEVSRRDFMKTAAGAAVAASLGKVAVVRANPADESPESLAKALYKSLTDEQRKHVALPWEHKFRLHVNNNWKVVSPTIGGFYTKDQQALIRDIVKGLSSGDGHERFQKAMRGDYGGFDKYHVAIFGNPEEGPFVWTLSGRHLTLKCDGHSQKEAVFGGPIFYGHAGDAKDNFNETPTHPGNVWWHQAMLANKVFGALDPKQQERALLEHSPKETLATLKLKGAEGPFRGVPVGDLSRDQKGLVEEVMKALLSPYRPSDVEEALKVVREAGGVDKLHLSFYSDEDLGSDRVWDNWMIEGPELAWFFRGAPHVHVWVNVGSKL